MWFCPRLRTLPKCPLEGESEIFWGPGEGMSVAWLQAWEADTQRSGNTDIVHGGTAAGCAPLFTPTLHPGLSQATSGSSLPSPRPPVGLHPHGQQLKGTDQTVAIATACPGARAGHGHGHLISLWVPSGPLMTPAVYPGCGFFFQPSCSDLDPLGHLVQPCQWDLYSMGLPVAPRPEAGVVAEPSGTPSLGRYAGGGGVPS